MQRDGQNNFGSNMNTEDYIKLFNKQIEVENPILHHAHSRYFSTIFRIKYDFLFNKVKQSIDNLSSVAFVAGFCSVQICHLFKSHYNCNIKLIQDHPSFEYTKQFYKTHFDTENHYKNAMFEDISDIINDVDLVVFPEYEYFVPLHMLKYYNKNKLTAVLSHHHLYNDLNQNQAVYDEQEILEQCDFNSVVDVDKIRNKDKRYVYFAMGYR